MNMIEAKQFEYAIELHREEWTNNSHIEPINYEILWECEYGFLIFNTYKKSLETPILYEIFKNGKIYTQTDIITDRKAGIFSYIKFYLSDRFFDSCSKHRSIYKNPEKLLQFVHEIPFQKDSPTKIDKSTIYNVSKPFSDNKLEFLNISENFNLDPVSLIKVSKSSEN